MKEQKLTTKEAYIAMIDFLDNIYEQTKSDDVAVVLGSMQLTDDGGTMDPTYWYYWMEAVRKVR